MGKGKSTCVLLAIAEQEREIQNAQVLSMLSKSRDKRTYAWAKAMRTCVRQLGNLTQKQINASIIGIF